MSAYNTEKKATSRRPQPRRSALAGSNPLTPPPVDTAPAHQAPPIPAEAPTPAAQETEKPLSMGRQGQGKGYAAKQQAVATARKASETKTTASTATERLGIYLTADEFRDARGAYLADWTNGGTVDTFGRWVTAAIAAHAARTTKQREALARPVGRAATRTGESRSWPIATEAIQAMREAIAADQEAGRWPSDSAWCGDAITAATEAARKANGGTLPEPPARLPNRLKRA